MNLTIATLGLATVGLALVVIWMRRRLEGVESELSSRRKQAQSLREEMDGRAVLLDRNRAVVAGASLGILVLDPRGAVSQFNPAAEEFVGARHGAALAESRVRSLVEAAVADRVQLHDEFEILSPMPRILHVTVEPIDDTDWAVAYVEDVTERRKVDAARTDFVANVSHELKTPLGALALLAETLESADDPEVRRRLIARIGEQAARMSHLVDDIMDLSLVEAAGMEPAVVDMNKVLASATANVRDLAVAGEVELVVQPASGDVLVSGDERQLVSAVGNLLSNAISYTAVAVPPRRVVASVFLNGPNAVVEIADTGLGIPTKHQRRIFERFYRVDSARSRDTGGTGLGLAIVRHVARNHGGSVELDSESGVGSTFRIIIPAGGGDIA